MSQLLVRTLRRGWTGVELWNGNREGLGNLIRFDPEQPYPSQVRSRLRLAARHILLWSWTYHARIGRGTGQRPLSRAGRADLPVRAFAA